MDAHSGSKPKSPEFYFYRRNLPHYRVTGATYFVTWRLRSGVIELDEAERTIIAGAIRHYVHTRYELDGFVVMNDHVHVMVRPLESQRLEEILRLLKAYTGRSIGKLRQVSGGIWQEESHDRIIRNEMEWQEKLNYIHDNPFRRWPELEAYPWMWVEGMK